ncbi:MAG: two component system sensor kinase [Naasia sp.]|jgi:signal transduction histidine kinase|uniref:sensor histidine kinase n=1 Tax=Naasia sp. TaxID=2546198 RepID=UPI0026074CCE|nr:sensor histidine kinase [Naasia sp.]MCU1569335.1 two component system sensor kinase [Naasia sp.]
MDGTSTAPGRRRAPLVRAAIRTAQLVSRIDLTAGTVVLACLAAIVLLAVETPIAVRVYDVPLIVAFALAGLHVGALPLAVLRPTLATLISLAATLGLQTLGSRLEAGPWPWWVVLLITQTLVVFLVALRAVWQVSIAGWLASVVLSTLVAVALHPASTDEVSANLVIYVSISGGALIVGIILGQWQLIRRQLLREREVSAEEYSRRTLAEDRARIARELHDVVAHSMSMINIQASTARYRNPDIDERSVEEFEEIAASSRQALREMRGLLGVLRTTEGPRELDPQPGLERIPELIDQAARAGMQVTLDSAPELGEEMTEVVGLAAYRIVQEALTNASRHAAGTAVTVRCERAGDDLVLTVQNTTPSSTGGTSGSRLGLIGMTERAASVGGTVTAGDAPDGGFLVRAVLPLHGVPDIGDQP